jgi:5-carboxymethyl-2-hydroxymuconate isomerase
MLSDLGYAGNPPNPGEEPKPMPHFIVEYSGNLEKQLDISGFVQVVHDAALATGVFPLKGIRTRAARRDHYRIADGHPDNAFIHLVARIGHGRTLEVRKSAGQAIFEAATAHLAPLSERMPLAVSFEIQEIDPDLNFKTNNLSQWIERRKAERETAG